MCAMIGDTVGPYKILEKLPAGGMGVVYKAEDTKLNRLVALKYLPPALSGDDAAKARFRQEARAASAIDHPNICTIYDFEETEDGHECIVMPFYEGGSLKQRVAAAGRLTETAAVGIALQVADGLAAAHARGVIHRDIKPANLIITTTGLVKIVDFGLAILSGNTRVTAEGRVLGTFAYMSPEQTRGDEVDSRSDLWALGVVLYEMVTGSLPFSGAFPQVVIHRIRNEAPDPIDARCSPALTTVVARALAKNPADRYQKAADLARDLTAILKQGRLPGVRMRLWWLATAAAAIALGVFGFPDAWRAVPRVNIDVPFITQANLRSVAVLPFRNRGSLAAYDYVGAGLADVLTAKLTRAGLFEVRRAPTPWQLMKQNADPVVLARQIGVEAVLTGTYQVEGGVLSLSYTLIEARRGVSLTGDVVEVPFSRTIEAEHRIALAVLTGLRPSLSDDERARAAITVTQRNDAFQAYLRSQYLLELFWRQPDSAKLAAARRALEQAVEEDPGFTLAIVRLVFVTWTGTFWGYQVDTPERTPVETLAADAISQDPTFGDAYAAKALLSFQDGKLDAMRDEIRAALGRSPNSALAHYAAGWYYLASGLAERSAAAFTRAGQLEPELVRRELGIVYRYVGDFARAEQQLREDLRRFPGDVATEANLALMLLVLGRLDEAATLATKTAAASPNDPTVQCLVALVNVKRGVKFDVAAWVARNRDTYWRDAGFAFTVAGLYALARDSSEAVVWLRRARELGFRNYPYVERYPFFANVRGDGAFKSVVAELQKDWEAERSREQQNPLVPVARDPT
jgi:tetratricopeptide (TPR) repeat protein